MARVDSVLLHAPPCVVGRSWNQQCFGPGNVYPDHTDCSQPEPCEMLQQQWRALEEAFNSGKARAIGVSNFTVAHLEALKATAKVWPPAVNQVGFPLSLGLACALERRRRG